MEETVPEPQETVRPELVEGRDEASTSSARTETDAPAQPADLSPGACAAALAERFPALFTPGKPLPIKLRIQADIQARAPGVFSKKSLSLFLHRHTTSTAYIRALLDAATRFDLDGQPAGEIAAEHREAAVAELERRRQIVQAKRQAERDAARAARPPQQPQQPQEARQAPRPARHERPRPPRQPLPQARSPQARAPEPQQRERPVAVPVPVPVPLTPEQAADHEARRARALLLRAFETSTISRANFCTLKRIDDATLEAQLQQARAERGDRGDPPRR